MPGSPAPPRLDPVAGGELVRIAVAALGAHLAGRRGLVRPPGEVALGRPGASFVTLESAGALRGCVGTVDVAGPLWRDVVRNAVRAADDPRLPRVTVADWSDLDITVSVLSRPEALPSSDRAALEALLRPGVDGLLFSDGVRRAVFLPAVWAKLGRPDRFVAALLVKGGWSARSWPSGLVAHRYTTEQFGDRAPRAALAS
jgi:AmmeMemoRadiSam system protein A